MQGGGRWYPFKFCIILKPILLVLNEKGNRGPVSVERDRDKMDVVNRTTSSSSMQSAVRRRINAPLLPAISLGDL